MDGLVEGRLRVQVWSRCIDLPPDVLACLSVAEQTAHDVQLGPSWFALLEETVYSGHRGIRYFVLRRGAEIVCVMPLLIESSRFGWNDAVSLANFYTAHFYPPLSRMADESSLGVLWAAIRKEAHPLRYIRLAPLNQDGEEIDLLRRSLRKGGLSTFDFYCFGNWYLETLDAWSGYLASRESKFRGEIKRMTGRLLENGGAIEIVTQPEDVKRSLAAYNAVYERSWKVPEPHPLFIPRLLALSVESGALRLGVVWLKDVPIAAQIWIVKGRKASIFKVAYDEAYRERSPGTVLTAALMQWVLDKDRVTCVDFLMGDDPYKKKWMNRRRERWGVIAYDHRTVWGILFGLREALYRKMRSLLTRLKAFRALNLARKIGQS